MSLFQEIVRTCSMSDCHILVMLCLQDISGVLPAALGVAAAAGAGLVILSEVSFMPFPFGICGVSCFLC